MTAEPDCLFSCQIYGMESGTLNFHGRLQDVKEFNPELFTVWQEKIKKARSDLCSCKSVRISNLHCASSAGAQGY